MPLPALVLPRPQNRDDLEKPPRAADFQLVVDRSQRVDGLPLFECLHGAGPVGREGEFTAVTFLRVVVPVAIL